MTGGWQVMACVNALTALLVLALLHYGLRVATAYGKALAGPWRSLAGLGATRAMGNERVGCGARDAVHQL